MLIVISLANSTLISLLRLIFNTENNVFVEAPCDFCVLVVATIAGLCVCVIGAEDQAPHVHHQG